MWQMIHTYIHTYIKDMKKCSENIFLVKTKGIKMRPDIVDYEESPVLWDG